MYCANASHVIALAWESREHGIVFWPFFVARKIPIPYIENRRATLPTALTARCGSQRYRQLLAFDRAFWLLSLFQVPLSQIGCGHRIPRAWA
jgi:hypothetical protein